MVVASSSASDARARPSSREHGPVGYLERGWLHQPHSKAAKKRRHGTLTHRKRRSGRQFAALGCEAVAKKDHGAVAQWEPGCGVWDVVPAPRQSGIFFGFIPRGGEWELFSFGRERFNFARNRRIYCGCFSVFFGVFVLFGGWFCAFLRVFLLHPRTPALAFAVTLFHAALI